MVAAPADGLATVSAIKSGRCVPANHPAPDAAAALASINSPSQKDGALVVHVMRETNAAPMAIPATNPVSMAAKAYVVGPSASASTRVKVTS